MDCATLLPLLQDPDTAKALMELLREVLTPLERMDILTKGLSCLK